MTTLGLNYLNYAETRRSNLVKEAETKRSNLVNEARNQASLDEQIRTNMEGEKIKWYAEKEQARSNKVKESISQFEAEEKARHNYETEGISKDNLAETIRHQLVSDEIAERSLLYKAYEGTINAMPNDLLGSVAKVFLGGTMLAEFGGNSKMLGGLSTALQSAANTGNFNELHDWLQGVTSNLETLIPPEWNSAEATLFRKLVKEAANFLQTGELSISGLGRALGYFAGDKLEDEFRRQLLPYTNLGGSLDGLVNGVIQGGEDAIEWLKQLYEQWMAGMRSTVDSGIAKFKERFGTSNETY